MSDSTTTMMLSGGGSITHTECLSVVSGVEGKWCCFTFSVANCNNNTATTCQTGIGMQALLVLFVTWYQTSLLWLWILAYVLANFAISKFNNNSVTSIRKRHNTTANHVYINVNCRCGGSYNSRRSKSNSPSAELNSVTKLSCIVS